MSQNDNNDQTPVINGHTDEPDQIDASALNVPPADNAVLQCLPGLTAAIDQAFQEHVGKKVAFVLVAFGEQGAAFTTNIDGAANMRGAMRQIADSWNEPATPAGAH